MEEEIIQFCRENLRKKAISAATWEKKLMQKSKKGNDRSTTETRKNKEEI